MSLKEARKTFQQSLEDYQITVDKVTYYKKLVSLIPSESNIADLIAIVEERVRTESFLDSLHRDIAMLEFAAQYKNRTK